MKGFTKIVLIIASVAIGILFIVIASVAWFTSNPEVDANDVSLSSANTLIVDFDSTLYKSNYSYDGQDGITETFVYPYGYFRVNISNSNSEKRNVVKMDFSTVDMKCAICEEKDISIEQLFDIQIACYKEQSGGGYDMESQDSTDPNYRVFVEATSGGGSYALIADDYYLGDNNYLYRAYDDQRVELPQGRYYFAFTYTFCPASGGGYVADAEGTYIGQVSYKQISGGPAYTYSGSSYTSSNSGEYTRVITQYVSSASVDKYTKVSANNYVLDNEHGTYIRIKDHNGDLLVGDNNDNNFAEFAYYSYVEGFPYADIRFQGAKYSFSIVCSVEEV